MNVLELFSGTGSVGKCCKELGWDVVSVDMEKKFNPTHLCNIMDFDYKQYPKNHFAIVWGSPPCTAFSILQGSWIGRHKRVNGKSVLFTQEQRDLDMIEADKIVLKTINYFNTEYWFMENPQSGGLKNREYLKDIPFYDVDYCKYSDWGYRKRTRIWTNKKDWNNLMCNKDCENMNGNTHKIKIAQKGEKITIRQKDKYRVPPDLIYSLFLD